MASWEVSHASGQVGNANQEESMSDETAEAGWPAGPRLPGDPGQPETAAGQLGPGQRRAPMKQSLM